MFVLDLMFWMTAVWIELVSVAIVIELIYKNSILAFLVSCNDSWMARLIGGWFFEAVEVEGTEAEKIFPNDSEMTEIKKILRGSL